MKYLQRIFSILLIVGMLLGWTTSGSILASAPQSLHQQADAASKFEPTVLEQLNSGKSDFFVTMAEQADLSYADQLQTKTEKGAYVFTTLVATADRTQANLRAYLDNQGVQYTSFYIVNTILVKSGDLALAQSIANRNDVSKISANHTYQLDKPMIDPKATNVPTGVEPNISFVKADQVWALGITGQGMIVAGNDTGLDETHPAIKARYRGCVNPPDCTSYDNNYNWWDATGTYPNDPWDGFGHGTHTTGTMMGDDGVGNQIGMAPGAQTIHCKNMTDSGNGDDNTFLTCFEWDLAPWDLNHNNPNSDLAPDAINNSWGYWGGGANQFREAINNLQAAGVLVEVSAGNEGPGCSSLRSPGDYWEVLTTGSVNHVFPYPGGLTEFSSRGPSSLDPEEYFPDIMAPGENIRSSVPGGGYEGGWSGTSMAGPHATGLIALIWSANPALRGRVADTIEIIQNTAVPLTGENGSNCGGDYDEGPNNDWGFGTIDALAAVQEAIAMGGSGQLHGTVSDADSGDPIEGVKINAAHTEGFEWNDTTDLTGYYTMTVAVGTYTVTASTYGYITQSIFPVVVVTDLVTTQDISLVAAPKYMVSGTVKDSVSGEPLAAELSFTDAPVPPVSTGPDGSYSIEVAQGTWHLQATADSHEPETREVVVDGNKVEDFLLDPLPCILLVDDDGNDPNVRDKYTSALDNLGYDYNIWDVNTQGDPANVDIAGYKQVMWFTGYPYGNTFNSLNEAAIKANLDAGGNFFLSSQDYLYDAGLTEFGQDYLHILNYVNDEAQTTVTGLNVYDGLGPYTLVYPFENYSDVVNPDAQAEVAFDGNIGNIAISYDGATFNTVFLSYPFEAITALADRTDVISRTIDFFGGCEAPPNVIIDPESQTKTDEPGMQVSYTYTVTNDSNMEQEVTLSITSTWPTVAPVTVGVLGPGDSASVPVTVTIPLNPDVIIDEDTFTLTAKGMVGGMGTAFGTTKADVTPGVELMAPEGSSGKPLEQISYEFVLTNTGEYTDSFTLEISGVWTATLPGGDNTGLLAAGASATITVVVTVSADATQGATDLTTLLAASDLDSMVAASANVTTTAILTYYNLLPIVRK